MEVESLLTGKIVKRKPSWTHFFLQENWKDRTSQSLFFIRIFIVVAFGTLIVANAITGITLQSANVDCIWDGLFQATRPINQFFRENETPRSIMLIISSFLVDILVVNYATNFILWGKTWRTAICLFCFYAFRGLIQNIFVMEFPYGQAWGYPGFPSLTVSYYVTNDFFFSGHVGVITILSLDSHARGKRGLMWISIATVFIEFWVMIFLRGHYTIDLISGILIAHYMWIISKKVSRALDRISGYKRPSNEYGIDNGTEFSKI
ncbi:unnamed protein product [Blepharisma stoltei]|uniref:AtPDCT1/2 transmembrane domain-containing protein n=1 Tax=Blepharisma stoltei TaxID=1481888 RepID=A0AAU9JRG4_9CILI|nr:unnamed protein product [Blepharisma stoltei]